MKIRSRMQNQKGFTLVELMVVVVILGILVAIAVPVYNGVQARAAVSACQANQRIIDSAIMQWQTEGDNMGKYPTVLGELSAYLQEEPKCPTGGKYSLPTALGEQTSCDKSGHARTGSGS